MNFFSEDLMQVNDALQAVVVGLENLLAFPAEESDVWKAFVESGFSGVVANEDYAYIGSSMEVLLSVAYFSQNTALITPYVHYACLAPMMLRHCGVASVELLSGIEAGNVRVVLGADSDLRYRVSDIAADEVVLEGSVYTTLVQSYNYLLVRATSNKPGDDILVLLGPDALVSSTLYQYDQGGGLHCADRSFTGLQCSSDHIIARGDEATTLYRQCLALHAAGLALMLYQPLLRGVEAVKAHVNMRQQFGHNLSAFQTVRHQLSDLTISLAEIEGLLARIVLNEQRASLDADLLFSLNKLVREKAIRSVNKIIQLHGGMGMTEELPISGDLKNMVVLSQVLSGVFSRFHQFLPGQFLTGKLNVTLEEIA